MINLLPPSYKQRLKQEWQFRILVILSIALLASLVALALLLLSIWIYLDGLVAAQQTQPAFLEEQTSDTQQLKEEIIEENKKMNTLLDFYKGYSPAVPIFEEIAQEIPDGVTITSANYSFEKGARGFAQVNFSATGETTNRRLLGVLRDNLQAHPRIQSVDLPLPGITPGKTLIRFSVRLKVEPISYIQDQ